MNPLYKIIAISSRYSNQPGKRFFLQDIRYPGLNASHEILKQEKEDLKNGLKRFVKILKKNTSSFINSPESKLISALKILCSPNLSPKDIEVNIKKLSKYFTKLLLKSNNAAVRNAVQKIFSLMQKEIQAQVMERFREALTEPKNIKYLNAAVLESFNFCNKKLDRPYNLILPKSFNSEGVVRLTENDVLSCKSKYESVSGQKFLTLYHGLERVDYQSFKTDFEEKVALIHSLREFPEIQRKLVSFLSDLFNGNQSCFEKKLVQYVAEFLQAGGITPNTKMVRELSRELLKIVEEEHEKQNALSMLLSNFNLPIQVETVAIDGKNYRLGKEFSFDNGAKFSYVMDDAEMGMGAHGIVKKAVMETPAGDKKLIVVKKVEIGEAILEREAEIGNNMGALGIGPKVFFIATDHQAKLHTRTTDGQSKQNGYTGPKRIMGMQLMDGDFVSLYDRSFSKKLEYSSSILEKVSLLHEQDLVHGDFKLENCLYKDDGTAYLSDFAGVQYSSLATLRELRSYTPEYMPADVLFGRAPVTKHVDVFSVAINLARFLSGKDITDFSKEEIQLSQKIRRGIKVTTSDVNDAIKSVKAKHRAYIRSLEIEGLEPKKLHALKVLLWTAMTDPKMSIKQFTDQFERWKMNISA